MDKHSRGDAPAGPAPPLSIPLTTHHETAPSEGLHGEPRAIPCLDIRERIGGRRGRVGPSPVEEPMEATLRTVRSTEPVPESRARGITVHLRKTCCRVAPIILSDNENLDNGNGGVDDEVDGIDDVAFPVSQNGIDFAASAESAESAENAVSPQLNNNNMNKNTIKPRRRVRAGASGILRGASELRKEQSVGAYYDASNFASNSTYSETNLGEFEESIPSEDGSNGTLIMAYGNR